jgi:thiol-disulfide isomerase/thioredoxin
MKKLSALFLTAVIAVSCSQKREEKPITIFSGKITNPKEKFLTLFGKDTIHVDSNGVFYVKLDSLKNDEYGHFSYGHEYTDLYIFPGDSLYVTFDTKEFDETMHYQGKGAEKNNFLAKTILLEEQGIRGEKLFSLDENEFKEKIDSVKNIKEQRLKNFLDSFPSVSETFKRFEQGKILYGWANKLMMYPGYHSYLTKTKSDNQKQKDDLQTKTRNDYYRFLSEIKIEDTTLLQLEEYKFFLEEYVNHYVNQAYKKDSTLKNCPWIVLQYKIAKEKFSTVPVKEHFIYDALLSQIKYNGTEGVYSLLNDFKSFSKNEKHIKEITEAYNKWQHLAKGNPAPGFKYVNINGDSVSLASLQGKYVYIDVWATWCGPCKAEIPHLEKVQEEFKKENIAFVSVSVDDDKSKWEKFAKEKSMKGIQLYAHGAWKSEIANKYNIFSIPRFIFVGTKGEIIDANAPRPSDKKLKELFNSTFNIKTI